MLTCATFNRILHKFTLIEFTLFYIKDYSRKKNQGIIPSFHAY